MSGTWRLLLITGTLYALGAGTLLVAPWLTPWPRLRAAVVHLGEAAMRFALGFLGLVLVITVLRSAGCIEPTR